MNKVVDRAAAHSWGEEGAAASEGRNVAQICKAFLKTGSEAYKKKRS